MPYSSNAELPDSVKKLSSELQTAWRKAFNSAYDTYGGDEGKANATAWAQVNKMRESLNLHPSFLRILRMFMNRYGEMGREKFDTFVRRNGLDPARDYNPRVQLSEAFTWAEPYIRYMKSDKGARYYAVRALHAIVSMNNNNYTDPDHMDAAAMSMNYRPLNINHDHDRWVPYPRTRVDYSKAEDMCVECILRVDNRDEYLQKQLDHDPSIPEKEWINHPSIEGRPLAGGKDEGYHFTALALLEKGYQLPGDPLTEIVPIILEGVQGGEVCMMVDGEKVCLECEDTLTEAARTDAERAMSHFNISAEDWAKLSPEQKADYIKKLPPRGSAQETIPEEGNTIEKELKQGEINQGGAACPNCGHVVNLDGIKLPSEIECPNCGTSMTARPEKTVESSARETVNTSETSNKLMTTEVDTLEQQAEDNTKIAELTNELVMKEKRITTLTNQLSEAKADLDEAIEGLADKTREAARVDEFKARTGELTEDIIERDSTIKEHQKKIEELENVIQSKVVRIDRLNKELSELKDAFESLKSENEGVRVERNDLSVKARASEEKALNETRERSRIQSENAKLLDDKRKLTQEISALSEKIANSAKKNLAQEEEIGKLQEKVRETERLYKEKLEHSQKIIEEAKKFHRWSWGKLKEAGYAIVQE